MYANSPRHNSEITSCAYSPEVASTTSLLYHLQSDKPKRKPFIRPTINATMAVDGAPSLRAHLSTRLQSRVHDTMVPRPTVVDGEETSRSTSEPTPTIVCSKNDVFGGKRHRRSQSSDIGDPDLGGSPRVPQVLQQGSNAHATPSPTMTKV
jgi:hypothetical protein